MIIETYQALSNYMRCYISEQKGAFTL